VPLQDRVQELACWLAIRIDAIRLELSQMTQEVFASFRALDRD
jgi:hypothetical protein